MKKLLPIIISLLPAAASAQTSMTVGYCGEPAMSFGVEWQEYTAVVEFPLEFVDKFDGAVIKAVEIASPDNFENPDLNNFTSLDLKFYNEVGGDAYYSQHVTLSDKAFSWNRAVLDTTMTIERGKPFCVGYSGKAPSFDDACFVVDCNYNDDCSGLWLGWVDEESGRQVWEPYTEWYGNLCLRLVLEGDNLPRNRMSLQALYVPGSVVTGQPFAVTATVTNQAANNLDSFTFSYTIGDRTETVEAAVNPPLPYGYSADVAIDGLVCGEAGISVPMAYSVTAVNGSADGVADDNSGGSVNIQSMPQGVGFLRNIVIEEGTGTWCGYCPMGIVALRDMTEKYTDGSFIPVAIHYNDKMVSESYVRIATENFSTYPSALVNRDTYRFGRVEPDPRVLEAAYLMAREIPAYAQLAFEADAIYENMEQLAINATATFAIDASAPHHIEVAFTQDGIGPYSQLNFFGNYAEGVEMGGFEELGEEVDMTFDHVACSLDTLGVLPANVVAGESYPLSGTVAVKGVDTSKEFDIIVMLVNDTTGAIENAASMKSDVLTGVAGPMAAGGTVITGGKGCVFVSDTSAGVQIFTASGLPVASLQGRGPSKIDLGAGFYIVKAGDKVSKIVVR